MVQQHSSQSMMCDRNMPDDVSSCSNNTNPTHMSHDQSRLRIVSSASCWCNNRIVSTWNCQNSHEQHQQQQQTLPSSHCHSKQARSSGDDNPDNSVEHNSETRCQCVLYCNTSTSNQSRLIASSSPPSFTLSSCKPRWSRPSSLNSTSILATLKHLVNSSSMFLTILLLCSFMLHTADSCSSRSTPKPRPPTPTTRPNITFQTYACPEAYAKWYCLNGATCFSVRIGESILYNCECSDGYMGQRCEFKDLDGSYLPSREKILVETAGIAGGVTLAVLLVVIISISYYTYLRNKIRSKSSPLLLPPTSPPLLMGYLPHRQLLDTGDDTNVPFYKNVSYYQHYSTFSPPPNKVNNDGGLKYGKYGATTTVPILPRTTAVNYQQCLACMNKLNKSSHATKTEHILDLETGKRLSTNLSQSLY